MDITSLDLKKFQDYGAKISRKFSLNKSFSIGLPPALFKEEGLTDNNHVILFFDETQKVIGLQFVNHDGQGEGFKINIYGEGDRKGASIIARSFFNKYNIDPKKYHGKYDFEKIQQDGNDVYLFQLKERTES